MNPLFPNTNFAPCIYSFNSGMSQLSEARKYEGHNEWMCMCPCEPTFCPRRAVEQQRRPPSTCADRSKREKTVHIHIPIGSNTNINSGHHKGIFASVVEGFLGTPRPLLEPLGEGECKQHPSIRLTTCDAHTHTRVYDDLYSSWPRSHFDFVR